MNFLTLKNNLGSPKNTVQSKKIIQSILLFFIANFYLINAHACCGYEEDEIDEAEESYRGFYSLPTHRKASNDLDTCFVKLDVKSRPGSKSYPEIKPVIYRDGSKTTEGYEAPSMLHLHVGAKIGHDDRVRVPHTEKSHWRVHGHMEMGFPNGKRYIGSGTMVNHRHVLTAAHCLYSHADGGWATDIKFTAAQNGMEIPIDPAYATHLLTVKGWKDRGDSHFDMGMVILDRDLGERTGWYGLSTNTDEFLKSLQVNVTGYPGDEDKGSGTQMWTMSGAIAKIYSEQFTYTLDTTGGQSGSGVYAQFTKPAGCYCVGIHTQGKKNEYNTATRITRSKFDRLVSWINGIWYDFKP